MNPSAIPADERWPLGEIRDLVFASALCVRHKMLMLVVLHHMRPDQTYSWPSWTTIVEESGLPRASLKTLFDGLLDNDWLLKDKADVVSRTGRRNNRYWTPRRDVVPAVPSHCLSGPPQALNLRRGSGSPAS